MSYVWDHSKLGGTELLCLLAIADFADDQGTAYPSVATLAQKIRMSERNAHYLLTKLVDSGELQIARNAGPKGCNLFRVQCLQGGAKIALQSLHRGAMDGAGGVQPIAPEPSLNHQKDIPSKKSKKQKARIVQGWWPANGTVDGLSREFGLRVPEDIQPYVASFVDYCQANGKEYADFEAAFRNCVRQDWPKLRARGAVKSNSFSFV